MIKNKVILLGIFFVLTACKAEVKTPFSGDLNCMLKMSNGYVTDQIGMQNTAESQGLCLDQCKKYANESIVSMKDAVETLSWKCFYNEELLHTETIK